MPPAPPAVARRRAGGAFSTPDFMERCRFCGTLVDTRRFAMVDAAFCKRSCSISHACNAQQKVSLVEAGVMPYLRAAMRDTSKRTAFLPGAEQQQQQRCGGPTKCQ